MRVLIFGASGMVGQGVLRACLADPSVDSVLVVGRRPLGLWHPKLRERVHGDFYDFSALEPELGALDACFFCLGVSATGLTEAEYRRQTYDLTLAAATPLARLNPGMAFIYVSGLGTDSSGRGSIMWARVKGQTESALLALPFRAAHMFRPGLIEPLDGIVPRSKVYRAVYTVLKPLMPLLKRWLGDRMLDTDLVGRAMIRAVRDGASDRVEVAEIRRLGSSGSQG